VLGGVLLFVVLERAGAVARATAVEVAVRPRAAAPVAVDTCIGAAGAVNPAGVGVGDGVREGAGVAEGAVDVGDCWPLITPVELTSGTASFAVAPEVGCGDRSAATIRNTGASTTAAPEIHRFRVLPLRTSQTATMAGMIASRHSTPPNIAVAGKIARTTPSRTTASMTAPKRLRTI
jgi:hypothetical protein